jgi:hypothetical protein
MWELYLRVCQKMKGVWGAVKRICNKMCHGALLVSLPEDKGEGRCGKEDMQ